MVRDNCGTAFGSTVCATRHSSGRSYPARFMGTWRTASERQTRARRACSILLWRLRKWRTGIAGLGGMLRRVCGWSPGCEETRASVSGPFVMRQAFLPPYLLRHRNDQSSAGRPELPATSLDVNSTAESAEDAEKKRGDSFRIFSDVSPRSLHCKPVKSCFPDTVFRPRR